MAWAELVGLAMAWAIVGPVFVSIGIAAYQAFQWLRMGVWDRLMVVDWLVRPEVSWVGAQQIIDHLWYGEAWAFCLWLAALNTGIVVLILKSRE